MKRQIAAFFLVASFCFILFAWTVPAKNRVVTKKLYAIYKRKKAYKNKPKTENQKNKKDKPKT